MKRFALASLLAFVSATPPLAQAPAQRLPRILTNDNTVAAGVLQGGALVIRLQARTGVWYPERGEGPGHAVHAFAETGGPLLVPGPLVRVVQGTEICVTIENTLRRDTLVVRGFTAPDRSGGGALEVPPGETREMRFAATARGTYYYWGTTTGAKRLGERYGMDSQLAGALVVDPPAAASARAADRVFVITLWADPDRATGPVPTGVPMAVVVNGLSWPHSERFRYTSGDSVRWRWINATDRAHPMHLHGAYFRVESRGDAARDTLFADSVKPLVVTETVAVGGTFSLLWIPDHVGNWLFHCHTIAHIAADLRLGQRHRSGTPQHASNHALQAMAGLVLGIEVLPAPQAPVSPARVGALRRLTLVARQTRPRAGEQPAYGFVLSRGDGAPAADSATIPGPPLVLTRSEPVRITVVNRLPEPTSIHWHGIELDSYYDGVSGWSGDARRRAPAIAPGDSFTVEFAPPRAGTFIYHTHFDEERQLAAGLYGALIVLEPGERFDPDRDRVLLLSTAGKGLTAPLLLNGERAPALDLDAGTTYRLRFININPNARWRVSLLDGEAPVQWRPLAKDGAPLPPALRTPRAAQFLSGVGETYDFELTPVAPTGLRFRAEHPVLGKVDALVRVHARPSGRPPPP